MVCPIPQTAGRPLPAYPFPLAGRLSVSLHTLVHGRLTVGVKRQFKFTANVYSSTLKIHTLKSGKKALLREGSSSAHGGDLS
jgi:hypothetical protein